ncbi:RING finger protein [Cladophialophora carrionii]|uniref:RING finger protein n=1 Tax=Cladophialophora carrionii TaxID=86049 RepID=A0A1C1CRJ3_9EURO|nr:RING finger protein [Cladophialophora carrionii]
MWLYSSTSKRSLNSKPSSPRPRSKTSSSTPDLRPTSPSSALAEVLRKNPFRAGSRECLTTQKEDEDPSVALNKDLRVLADFFPDVQVEVLRELLLRFDGDSRLPICIEQLYKYKAGWAKGRMNVPPRGPDEPIAPEEQFRTKDYIDAVKWIAGLEFGALSRNAVDAVLAEVNFSYANARPTLQGLAGKSWKFALANLLKKKRSPSEVPAALLDRSKAGPGWPRLITTGNDELDQELSQLFSLPAQPSRKPVRDQKASDFEVAQALNLKEAEEAGALFECQVCYNDITFEDASVCTRSSHVICLDCVRRTLNEALFGQGWAKSIDVEHGTLKCLADDDCDGHIPHHLVQRSLNLGDPRASGETWNRFEERLAEHNLQRSALSLVRCPFCPYAEAEQTYDTNAAAAIQWHIRKPATGIHTVMVILLLELLPATILFLLPFFLLFPTYFTTLFYTSLANLALKARTTRFVCRNPSCLRKSCLKCQKAWHDPHVCHEPLIVSLRTTVEAARTAAIKRICPRCGTAFVKSSGCNKLTCVCGYSMCYLCRKNIGKAGNNTEGGEGYRHFCEHFRPMPGQRCTECDKCDLYRAEDEDMMVKKAGEEAERLWREKEGMVGVKGLEDAVGNVAGEDTWWKTLQEGRWTVQGIVDWAVENSVVVDVER